MLFEEFFRQFQYTFVALSGVSTFLAVVVALYLARRNEGIRLKAHVSIWDHINPDQSADDEQSSIQVNIANIGLRSAWLPYFFFAWQFPFSKLECAVDHKNQVFPLEIPGGRRETIKLHDLDEFKLTLETATALLKYFKKTRIKNCRAFLCTEDGKKFRVKISPPLRKEFLKYVDTI